jgi:hypothetical protein
MRTSIFVSLVFVLLAGVHVTEKICEDRTGLEVVSTPKWKPVTGRVNKLACKKGAESVADKLRRIKPIL